MRPWTFRRFNPFIGIIALLKVKPIIPMVLIIGLIYLSQSLMQCTWALYTEFRYGWTPLNIGLSMFVLGLCIAFTQGWLLPALIRVQSEKHLVIAALSIGCLALAGIGFTTWGIVAAILCLDVFAPWNRLSDYSERGLASGLSHHAGLRDGRHQFPQLILRCHCPGDLHAASCLHGKGNG